MTIDPNRLIQLGGTLVGVSGAAAVAFWIYVLESHADDSFWSAPGIVSLSVGSIGSLLLVGGLFVPDNDQTALHQRQKSGKDSRNYQAGRDITLNGRRGNADEQE